MKRYDEALTLAGPRQMPGERQAARRRGDGLAEYAESVRMAKLNRSIRLPLQPHRRRQFCAIRSYLPTAAKHGMPFFTALVMLMKAGHRCPVRRNQPTTDRYLTSYGSANGL
jgi:hypothetical protein